MKTHLAGRVESNGRSIGGRRSIWAKDKLRSVAAFTLLFAAAVWPETAQATEGGASIYLLGSGGPEAAMMPPVEGVFFDNSLFYLHASAGGGRQFPVGGNIVADLEATILADFPAVLWVPTTDLGGAAFAVGVALPFGEPSVDVSAVITGPLGGQVGVSRSDSAVIIGDPLVTAALGWSEGNYHWQASTFVNIPIGNYREDELANLAFHRLAADFSFAATWHDDESGWDVSGKAGVTFNGENEDTDYDTGTELHFEGAVEKTLSPAWAVGLQAYYFDQVTGDSGAGATLGPFEGEVTGVGATVAYHFPIGHMPATLRFRALTEFNATNRLAGDIAWLEFSVPLHMNPPDAE